MRTKRALCCFLLALTLAFCLLQLPQTTVEASPLSAPSPSTIQNAVDVDPELNVAAPPENRPAFSAPAAFLQADAPLEAYVSLRTRRLRLSRGYRPSVSVLAKNHPLLAPPIEL